MTRSPSGVLQNLLIVCCVGIGLCMAPDGATAKKWFKGGDKKGGGGVLVAVEQLHPTQPTVERGRLAKKSGKLGAAGNDPGSIDAVLAKKPVQAVIGPGGKLYIADGHHRTQAARQRGLSHVRVQVTEDLSAMSPQEFWAHMQATGRAHLIDKAGRRVAPSQLPSRVEGLKTTP